MDTAEYNATRGAGEAPVGFVPVAAAPAQSTTRVLVRPPAPPLMAGESLSDYQTRTGGRLPDPDPHRLSNPENRQRRAAQERAVAAASDAFFERTGMLLEHAEEEVRRARGVGGRDAGIVPNATAARVMRERASKPAPNQPAEAEAAGAPKQLESESGLAHKDAWDLEPGERGEPVEPEGFDRFRYGRGHTIEVPETLALDTRFEEAEITSVARDAGIAAHAAGISQVAAQAIFNIVADGYEPPPEGGFDLDQGLGGIRQMAGEQTDALIENAQKYTASRPALRAYLEETGLGNHPQVVAALAVLAVTPSLSTKAGALSYIEQLKKQDSTLAKSYLSGNKLEVFAARLVFSIAAGGK